MWTPYVLGDEVGVRMGLRPVGVPHMGGYAVGRLIIERYLAATAALLSLVEGEIVVGDLPRRVEHKRRNGDSTFTKLGHRVPNLSSSAPDVGRDPWAKSPWRRQGRAAG